MKGLEKMVRRKSNENNISIPSSDSMIRYPCVQPTRSVSIIVRVALSSGCHGGYGSGVEANAGISNIPHFITNLSLNVGNSMQRETAGKF